jgi:long-subunit fatty acid transport protein
MFQVGAAGQTAGAFANGLSAAAAGRGGTMTAEHSDPLDAVEGNPAGLAGVHERVLNVSGAGLLATGSYQNSADKNGHLTGNAGALGYGAFALPLGKSSWVAALGVTPDALMRVHWRYVDPAGTAGVSYGLQTNCSETAVMRTSVALAKSFGPKWALGASLGLDYNTNTLQAPYIFQQQPQLAGLKVLIDLHTRGFGWNGSAGAQWQPTERLRIGAAWKSATYVQSHGGLSGTASALFSALGVSADPTFRYKAEVDNQFPQTATVGAAWQASRIRLGLEGDWVDWSNAFKQLPIKLTGGTNAVINSVAGSSDITDFYPFHWRNQGVIRMGTEMPLSRGWIARGGYAYMSNPVPSKTLMPLTSAILQNTLSAGAGWSRERWHWNAAYQVQLPASQQSGKSELLAGEYDNNRVAGMVQSLTISANIKF